MTDPRESIADMLERYKVAIYNKDLDGLVALYDSNARIFDAWDRWAYEGLEKWKSALKAWFDSPASERVVVISEGMEITASNQLGAAHGFMVYKAVSLGGVELRSTRNRFTWTLEHRGGRWRVIHEHTSVPVDYKTEVAVA